MVLKKCYECGEFVPCYYDNGNCRDEGVCKLVSDYPGFVERNESCIWRASCGEGLSVEQIIRRDAKSREEHLKFMEGLERASEIVKSWPEWKQHILR